MESSPSHEVLSIRLLRTVKRDRPRRRGLAYKSLVGELIVRRDANANRNKLSSTSKTTSASLCMFLVTATLQIPLRLAPRLARCSRRFMNDAFPFWHYVRLSLHSQCLLSLPLLHLSVSLSLFTRRNVNGKSGNIGDHSLLTSPSPPAE